MGGGVAGLTAAARLAENASLSVAVIEAGTFYEIAEGNSSQIPGFTALFAQQNATDWNQYSTPQRVGTCFGNHLSTMLRPVGSN